MAALPMLDGGQATWHMNLVLAVAAVTSALIVGLVASLQPALRASRLEPNEALRAL